MKKAALVILFAVAGCSGTAPEPAISVGDTVVPAGKEIQVEITTNYWQDAVLKPNQSWKEAYGTDDHSVLAHGVAQLTRAVQAQAGAIGILKTELDALKPDVEPAGGVYSTHGVADPNGVK